jgi:trehalose utilization protein
MSNQALRVVIWDENGSHIPKELYPEGLRGAIAEGLRELAGEGELEVRVAHLDEENQGVTPELLAETDVLVWWGHARHGEVRDEVADWVKERVHKGGMGFVCLHSGHYSKTFRAVVEDTGDLKGGWRESETDSEVVRVAAPWHPVAEGVEDFTLENEEMYGAPFGVPSPEVLVLQSFFPAGRESFPCGIAWTVGDGIDPAFTSGGGNGANRGEGVGRVFYFRPGHESFRTYYDANVRKVVYNAVKWTGKLLPWR